MQPLRIIIRDRRRFGCGGFTIVEMMVAMAITGILVLVLVHAASLTSSILSRVQGSTDRHQSARAIMDAIGSDLSGALLSISPSAANDSAHQDGLQFIVNPDLPTEWENPSAIFWQAPIALDAKAGEVAEVGYFVKWDKSDASNPKSILCRFYVPPDNEGAFRVYSDPANWLTAEVVDSVTKADKASGYAGLFAENVLGLWIRCLKWDAASAAMVPISGATERFDSREGYDSQYDPVTGEAVTKRLPYAVEIGLVLLDSRHAARIGGAEEAAITELVTQADSAKDFVERARKDETLKKISPGMSAHSSTIHLKNYSDLHF